jgi:hypothetical protein
VASLVLSIVWIGGLGSILAIIFGFLAKKDIKQSSGAKSGGGVAIAGIVIGFVGVGGLALLILLAAVVGNAANTLEHDLRPRTVPFGTTVNISGGDTPGLRTIKVYALTFPSTSEVSGAPSGQSIVAARIRVCAGSSGSQDGFNALLSGAFFRDGQSGDPDFFATVRGLGRNLTATIGFASNQCISGYVPYDVAKGTYPIGVEYTPGIFIGTVHWTG